VPGENSGAGGGAGGGIFDRSGSHSSPGDAAAKRKRKKGGGGGGKGGGGTVNSNREGERYVTLYATHGYIRYTSVETRILFIYGVLDTSSNTTLCFTFSRS
jgi:hypothetical protein